MEKFMEKPLTHNNVQRCLYKWILISVAIEAAMLEDSMTSHDNALQGSVTAAVNGLVDKFDYEIYVQPYTQNHSAYRYIMI